MGNAGGVKETPRDIPVFEVTVRAVGGGGKVAT